MANAATDGARIQQRINTRFYEIADTILLDGSNPWEVDEAMVAFGCPMGPYETQDLVGLDRAYNWRKQEAAKHDPKRRYVLIADRMVEEGRLGKKVGVGWYRYPGGNGKVEDPIVEDLIIEEAYFAKVERRTFSENEIQTRLFTALINEACCVVDDGWAHSFDDVMTILNCLAGTDHITSTLNRNIDAIGADVILAHMRMFELEDRFLWTPSQHLIEIAHGNEGFSGRAAAS
ncbi:MAG: 3-hydroxyacyl-CoA dehydrogenase family protein [Pseudomonadota bacterium]